MHVIAYVAVMSTQYFELVTGWYDNIELTGKMHAVGWSHLIFDSRYSDIVDIYEGGYMQHSAVCSARNRTVV